MDHDEEAARILRAEHGFSKLAMRQRALPAW